MKVKNTNAGRLSNFEVAAVLEQQARERREVERKAPLPGARRAVSISVRSLQDVELISDQTLGYLDKSPCALQSRESIGAFIESLSAFKLTRAEELMLINARPRSLVEVHLIVEECEERLTGEETQQLLDLCALLDAAEPAG